MRVTQFLIALFLGSLAILASSVWFMPNAGAAPRFEWSKDKPHSYCLGQIDFVDDLNGGTVCAEYFYKTSDGGRSWQIAKIFEPGAHQYGLHVEGIKFLSATDILIVGTYVYRDASGATQNEIAIVRSIDGGATFSETVIDGYEGVSRYGTELIFNGDTGAFARRDGSAVYYTSDRAKTWRKTEPPSKNMLTNISFTKNGNIRVLRFAPGKKIDVCTFDAHAATANWTCADSQLNPPKLESGQLVGAIATNDLDVDIIAMGREKSVVGGVFMQGILLPKLKSEGSCHKIQSLGGGAMSAVCIGVDNRSVFGPEEVVRVLVSLDNGATWEVEYTASHPHIDGVAVRARTLSDGTKELFVVDGQQIAIARIH